jgi:hypothetical protein
MGQINFFILILIVYSLWLLKKKKEFASGILLGASLAIKLFPVLLPVYFLVKLRKKILLGIVTSFLVSTLLVIIFIPEKIYIDFISSVLPTLFSSWKLDYYNQALTGFIGRSFGTEEEAVILKSFSSVIIILATFFVVVYNKKKDFLTIALKIGVLITANLLVNTFSWQHHFVWLIIPFYASVFFLKEITVSKKEKSIYCGVLAISYFLISINFSHPQTLPLLFQSHVFFGAIILFFLQFKLLYDGRVNNKKRKSKTV